MEKRLTMFFAALFLMIGTALAQTKVNGTVISQDDNEPVIGASVLVVGTQVGTVTDANGQFSLTVPAGKSTLRITYVGMEPIEVSARPNMRIMLTSDQHALDEVIVVAYGTQKKSAFTGSASVVGSEEIGKLQVTNVVDALKGKAAGVQMTKASGAPGSTSTIRIRGISSINASNSPLIVVDGSPFDGDINTINPSDIESMTVLKDASSSALYGARGANGVIIINTKKGKLGEGTITVDAKWGVNSRAIPDYQYITSPHKYYEVWYQALKNYAMTTSPKQGDPTYGATKGLGYDDINAHNWALSKVTANGRYEQYGLGYQVFNVPEGQEFIGLNGRVNPNATLGNIVNGYYFIPDNWIDETFSNSLRQEYTVQAQGASTRGSYYASFSYLGFDGITHSSDYKRYNGRLKADYKIKDWLKVTGNVSYTHYEQNGTGNEGESGSSGNVFALTKIAPIYPIYNRDATGKIIFDEASGINSYDYGDAKVNGVYRPYLQQANPLSSNQLDINNTEGNTLNAIGAVEVQLPYDFKVTSTNTVYLDEYRGTQTTNAFYGQYASSNGIVYKSHGRRLSTDFQQILSWAHSYGKNNISAQFGHDYYRTRIYNLSGSTKNQFSPSNDELNGAVSSNGNPSSSRSKYNTESFFLRGFYNWNETYFAEASILRQASSNFAKDHRWGTFYSLGGAWLISKEKWFNAKWVDELRFKISYGQVGNDGIGSYLYTGRYTITPSNGNAALIASSTMKNEDITWETGGMFNIGVDFSFWKGRLSGNVEFFSRKTSDMLFPFSLPYSFGYTQYYKNIGDMMNNGIEFALNGEIIRTKDFTWSANLNFSYDHNYVSYLPDENKTLNKEGHEGYSDGSYFVGEGLPLYTFYLHQFAGVDPENGLATYWKDVKDAEGNITGREKTYDSSAASYYLCGQARPEVFGGFGTGITWKDIDFSVQFSYQLGGKIYDSDYRSAMMVNKNNRGHAYHVDVLNAWTPENTTSNIPRISYDDPYAYSSSDYWLISASYLSLDNIQIGYTLPKKWVNKIGIKNVRVYATGDNIWVWSKRQGLDPRQSMTGGANQTYAPSLRTISGGITVTF